MGFRGVTLTPFEIGYLDRTQKISPYCTVHKNRWLSLSLSLRSYSDWDKKIDTVVSLCCHRLSSYIQCIVQSAITAVEPTTSSENQKAEKSHAIH